MKINLLPTPGENTRTTTGTTLSQAGRSHGFNSVPQPHGSQHTELQNYPLRHGSFSKTLYKTLPPPFDIGKIGNLSIQDWTGRLMLWTLYIPQAYLAIKYKQHPFEVISRNLLIWTSTLALVLLERSPKYGFTRWVDPLMRPKLAVVPERTGFLGGMRTSFAKWINNYRIESNYLEFLQKAGIKDATHGKPMEEAVKEGIWAHLKSNEMNTLVVYLEKQKKNLSKLQGQALKQGKREVADLTKFISRFTTLGGTTFAIANLSIALVVGVLMNRLLFKFFAPLDKKFTPKTKVADSIDKTLEMNSPDKVKGHS